MKSFYNVKHCYVICLKFGAKFLISRIKLVPEVKPESALQSKKTLFLCWRKFWTFVAVVIIQWISITRSIDLFSKKRLFILQNWSSLSSALKMQLSNFQQNNQVISR